MPNAAVIATTVTTPVTQVATLFLGGASVLKAPGGSGFGVPIESIEVVEAGPGGVSSMEFTVDDPNKEVGLAAGTEVQFWNVTANVRRFRGYVDHWSSSPDFGGQGRTHHVICTGVEAWLDWLVIPAAFQSDVSQNLDGNFLKMLTPLGSPLTIAWNATIGTRFIGLGTTVPSNTSVTSFIVPAGTSYREAIGQLIAHSNRTGVYALFPVVAMTTVDFDLTLRVWTDSDQALGTFLQPADYTTLTVGDTPAAAIVAENLQYAVEPGDIPHEVLIVGGNAAGSGLFGDGTGLRSRQGVVTDPLILTAADAALRATNYLGQFAPQVRGNFTLSDFTPATTVHAGSLLALTNDETSATGTYRIFEIRKTFLADNRETWRVAFGGLPPSAVSLLRKLTRSVAA